VRALPFVLAALVLLAGETVGPVFAQDAAPAPAPQQFADPKCPTLAEVEAILTKNHEKFVILDTTDLLSVATDGESKIIVSTVGKVVTLGYEQGGCVVGPIGIAAVKPKVGA
jgi:hypothetical protein